MGFHLNGQSVIKEGDSDEYVEVTKENQSSVAISCIILCLLIQFVAVVLGTKWNLKDVLIHILICVFCFSLESFMLL